jgi:hypothetical protein
MFGCYIAPMIFQYPAFLWALVTLAIPIVIHLFNFRRTIRVYFSNTRFLKQIHQETTQQRKLKQYLVLAARLLFLFFLVGAFAQPFLKPTEEITTPNLISIYVDNSFSMSSPIDGNMRALDEAVERAQQLIHSFPSDTRYQLITNDFAPFANSPKTKIEVEDFLSTVRLSGVSRSGADILKRHEGNSTLFWISDFQSSTLGTLPKIDSATQLRLVPVRHANTSNVFVDSIRLENPFMIGGEKNTLHVLLRNSGDKSIEGLVVKLSLNDKQVSASTIRLEPQSVSEVLFDLSGSKAGQNRGVISFSDFPISFDNEFYFTLNYSGKLRVREIKQANEKTYVEKVFANKDVFDFISLEAKNLNYSLLQQADLVVVNGLDQINPTLAAVLATYHQSHAMLFIPSAKPDIASYQKALGTAMQEVTDKKEFSALEPPDWNHPLFQNIVEEKTPSMAMPVAKKLIDWGVDQTALLKMKDGRAFLSQFGNLFVLASPLDQNFTDFFQHALFVPFMYRLAASGKQQTEKLYYTLSSPLVAIPTDSIVGERPLKLVGSQELVPSQRKINNEVLMELPKFLLTPGFYAIVHPTDTLGWLAINADKPESLLKCLSAEELVQQWNAGGQVRVVDATSAQTFGDQVRSSYLGRPLWRYCLLLSLLFLLVEVLLLRFLK